MTMPPYTQTYEYYQSTGILPTHAAFKTPEQLKAYEDHRREFFTGKLKLPPRLFRGAEVVEFGPDSGENALVLARWGASVTLVEPNANAWPVIAEYFQRFNLSDRLACLARTDLQGFRTEKRFDFILAEGFISYIKPESIWIERFKTLLTPDGFAVISIHDSRGMVIDFFNKVIYHGLKDMTGDPMDAAWKIFETKWNSIPHTRSFEAWAMDNLRNPVFVGQTLTDTEELMRRMAEHGFQLYSSWPDYQDGLDVYWHKRAPDPAADLRGTLATMERSRLSYFFGRKLFLATNDRVALAEAGVSLKRLLSVFNRLLDGITPDLVSEATATLRRIGGLLDGLPVLAQSDEDRDLAKSQLDAVATILRLLAERDLGGLIAFCNTDPGFLTVWGRPNHYAVFRPLDGPAGCGLPHSHGQGA